MLGVLWAVAAVSVGLNITFAALFFIEKKSPSKQKTQELAEFIRDVNSGIGFIRVAPESVLIRSARDRA